MAEPSSEPDSVEVGWAALARGDWRLAHETLSRAAAAGADPRAWEGLAEAARWLGEVSGTFAARERAYQLYREAGDDRAAARMATWLAYDSLTMRGDLAVAGGWLSRGRRLLERDRDAPEVGWLAYREGELAMLGANDPVRALELGAVAAEVGRRHRVADLEVVALALRGLAQVSRGAVAQGMSCLDEAAVTALAGEVSAFHVAGTIYCHLISACERVRDLSRAAQWCDVTLELAGRWRAEQLFGVCRSHYAGLLIWRGRWEEAENELTAAQRAFAVGAPAMAYESRARLGWLRCRQGRLDEAESLCRQVAWYPLAQLGLVEVALARGDLDQAARLADRHLRALPAADQLLRAPGLELAIRVAVAAGNIDGAEARMAELDVTVSTVETGPLRASRAFCAALLARARGDLPAAQAGFVDAVDLWTRDGAPYETAVARTELGAVLRSYGDRVAAVREWQAAREAFATLGAILGRDRVDELLSQTAPAAGGSLLSNREREVLRLVADGLSDREIGARLRLSPHTVHRHVANIRTKLGQPSRAAAVAYAARVNLL
jgi:LuxR family maltose regulon positive regulatory protein